MTAGKRLLDLVVGAVLGIGTLPVVLVVAVVSAATYRAWPFFTQRRVGLGGEEFLFVKIRTLPVDTGRYLDKYTVDFGGVPPVMLAVRRLHLDELPQLWHVISGRMSLVGPRPDMAVVLQLFPERLAAVRGSVRPGVTGLWQVSAHCDGLIVERPEYDILYVEHRSLMFDLWIAGQTVRKILTGRTIRLPDVPRWAYANCRPAVPLDGVAVADADSQPNRHRRRLVGV